MKRRWKRWSIALLGISMQLRAEEKRKLADLGEVQEDPFFDSRIRRDRELSETYGVPMGTINALWATPSRIPKWR